MKKGFTLSEILITLGIVGIVAVLTVPSVMKNYKNRMYVAQLQKIYSQISDAAQSIMNDEHVDNFYETSAIGRNVCVIDAETGNKTCDSSGLEYFLTSYFKVIKENCATGTHPCLGSNYRTLSGTAIATPGGMCVQTVNGATVCAYQNTTSNVLSLIVDVNGPAEPNIAGRDVFSMDVKTDASLSDYGSGSNVPNTPGASSSQCSVSNTSLLDSAKGCLTSVIEAGWKMEY